MMTVNRSAMPSRAAMPAALGAVHADRVHLVEEGHRSVALCDLGERCDVARHGVDGLRDDELRAGGVGPPDQLLKVPDVVVAEDVLLGAAVAQPVDDGSVVQLVGEDHAPLHPAREDREGPVVRGVSGAEQQRLFLAVQIRQLLFEEHVVVVGAPDVAGTAGPGSECVDGFLHGIQHERVLPHAEVVVAAPNAYFGGVAVALGPCACGGKSSGQTPDFQKLSFIVREFGHLARKGLQVLSHDVYSLSFAVAVSGADCAGLLDFPESYLRAVKRRVTR